MSASEFNSALVQKGRLLPGIHGLRGIAALAVVFYHLVRIGRIEPPEYFDFIGRDFGYSVHLFFIISAFSLMYTTESRTNHVGWVREYFAKRFFRIAPLFYLVVATEIIRQAIAGRVVVDLSAIILNMTFTFGFVPFSGFVWGGWSVGVEMIFYAFFPVLVLLVKSHRSALLLVLATVLISYVIRDVLHSQHMSTIPAPKYDWSYFAFASNICFFAMGIYVYRLNRLINEESFLIKTLVPLLAVSILIGLMIFDLGELLNGGGRLDIVVWGIGLAALSLWQSMTPSYVIANRLFEYLGERSFSIYLLHPIVIFFSREAINNIYSVLSLYISSYAYFVCAVVVVSLVLMFAELTYRLVEVPGINLGRKIMAGKGKS